MGGGGEKRTKDEEEGRRRGGGGEGERKWRRGVEWEKTPVRNDSIVSLLSSLVHVLTPGFLVKKTSSS